MIEQLKAVLSSPRSLQARHALAEYLIGVNDPLGQVIDSQLRLYEGAASPTSSRYHHLLAKHEADWTAAIREFTPHFYMRLGLVAHVAMSGEALVARGKDVLHRATL